MSNGVVLIDGRDYGLTVSEGGIKRKFEIVDTDKAGRLITGEMLRDVVGTYYNYTVSFMTNKTTRQSYDAFYEAISAPVDYHMITIPYAQEMLTFKAYVTNGQDTLVRIDKDGNRWNGISINFVSMAPKRRAL
jgi:hypothetical protein